MTYDVGIYYVPCDFRRIADLGYKKTDVYGCHISSNQKNGGYHDNISPEKKMKTSVN
jgi:hypothetical protein